MSHQSELISSDIHAYLAEHENKELLRFLTCGSVDDGKSTLIGRLLHDSKLIYEDQLAAVARDSKVVGTTGGAIDLALLVDGLQAEREQGITIDVAYRYFSTSRRKFIIADTPGHEQYTRNMATGASTCDLAIILIDARKGVQVQTKRHSFIVSLLGIRTVIVAVNKMDLVDFSPSVFEAIRRDYLAFAEKLDLPDIRFLPLSALTGDNVVNPSPAMSWYDGPPLMDLLNTVEIADARAAADLRFPVQWVNRPNLDFRGFSGTLAAGIVKAGDPIMALPSRKTSRVKSIVTFDGELEYAVPGQAITLTLDDELDISRGDLLVHPDHLPMIDSRFDADLVWMSESPLIPNRQYLLKHTTHTISGSVSHIHYRIDVNTLESAPAIQLNLNEIGRCEFVLNGSIPFDAYGNVKQTGAFIVIDRMSNATVGAGMIKRRASRAERLSRVTAEERSARLGQKAATVWVSGENRLREAYRLERRLFDRGFVVAVIDEAVLGEQALLVAQQFNEAGIIVLGILAEPSRIDAMDSNVIAAHELDADSIITLVSPTALNGPDFQI